MRKDPVERRIRKLVERLGAEEFKVAVDYDTNNRHRSVGRRGEWHVTIRWNGRGWRNYPSDERELSGFGHSLTEALDALDVKVNSAMFRDAVAAPEDGEPR